MKKEIITQSDPKSPISEVFRALRTNLQFMNRAVECQTILITSTVQSEGKSWVSANLATTFAQTGSKTLIIDADMRKPRQHKMFQTTNVPGLSNYLSGINDVGKRQEINVINCIKQTNVENLYLLPSGNIPPNPSELLMSDKTISLIDEVTKNFDVVIFDGAPCLLVTDSTIISRLVDNTVLVTSHKYTKIDDLKEATKRIKRVGGNIAGVILNRIEISNKKYENKYYYASSNVPSTSVKSSSKIKRIINEDVESDKQIHIKDYEELNKPKRLKDEAVQIDKPKRLKEERVETKKSQYGDDIANMSKKVKDEWDIHKNPKSLRIDYEDETLDRSDSEQNENINEYINDRVKDTEEKIKMEIQRNNGKRFSEIEEVPSDKAKEILESIKRFK